MWNLVTCIFATIGALMALTGIAIGVLLPGTSAGNRLPQALIVAGGLGIIFVAYQMWKRASVSRASGCLAQLLALP